MMAETSQPHLVLKVPAVVQAGAECVVTGWHVLMSAMSAEELDTAVEVLWVVERLWDRPKAKAVEECGRVCARVVSGEFHVGGVCPCEAGQECTLCPRKRWVWTAHNHEG